MHQVLGWMQPTLLLYLPGTDCMWTAGKDAAGRTWSKKFGCSLPLFQPRAVYSRKSLLTSSPVPLCSDGLCKTRTFFCAAFPPLLHSTALLLGKTDSNLHKNALHTHTTCSKNSEFLLCFPGPKHNPALAVTPLCHFATSTDSAAAAGYKSVHSVTQQYTAQQQNPI